MNNQSDSSAWRPEAILANYPTLFDLGFHANDVLECKKSSAEFVLRDILERENVPYWKSFLQDLNGLLERTAGVYNQKALRDKLCTAPLSTRWELEFADYCLSKGIKIVPNVKTNNESNVDFGVTLGGQTVLVDAHVRRLKLKEEGCGLGDITRDLCRSLEEKIIQNAIPGNLSIPLIIAIDGEYAGIDRINVEAAFDLDYPTISSVSGTFLKNGNYAFISNPKAKNPLSKLQTRELI